MHKTSFRIVSGNVKLSNHGLATHDIEKNPKNSGAISLFRNKERAVLFARD